MPYPIRHKLLTINGTTCGGGETFSFGMRIIPDIAALEVTQAQVDAIQPFVTTFWNAVGNNFPTTAALQYIKLAPIDTDGRYPDGEDAVENTTGMPDAGASASAMWPPQCGLVVSLETAASRGRGHIGRCYLPTMTHALEGTGLINAGIRDAILATFRTMVLGINGATDVGTVGVITPLGVGTSRAVTAVRMGRVVDTQRRRRRSLTELPASIAL